MPSDVPAASRTMALFEAFGREKRPLSNSELARLLNLPESSCSDLVHTLVKCGFLMRTVKTRRIYPSGRLAGVTREISKNDAVFSVMSEACELLRDRTGESVLCGQIEEGFVRVIAFIEGLHPLRYASAGGDKLSLHVSALGKAILAIGSPEEAKRQLRMKPLKKLAPDTITEIESLEIQIEDIRKQGWALVENEGGEDLAAMAVAGFINREPFAISIAGPVGRLRLNRDEYLKALREVQALLFEDATQ